MYNIILYYNDIQVKNFQIDKFMDLDELVDYIKATYGDIKYNKISIGWE